MSFQEEKILQARVPKRLYERVENRIKLGLYSNKSEIVREALRRMFADQSREFLRELVERTGITEREMLKELRKIRSPR